MRNFTLKLLATVGVASLASTAVLPADPAAKPDAPVAKEASIPFLGRNIRDWQADGREGLWIQDTRGKWYYAKTLGDCIGLDSAWSIALDARPAGTFDRFGVIILPGHLGRCNLTSLTESAAPTKDQRRARPHKPADKESAESTEAPATP